MDKQERANRYKHGSPKPMYGNISVCLMIILVVAMVAFFLYDLGVF